MAQIGGDEPALLFGCRIGLVIARPGSFWVMVVVAPFSLPLLALTGKSGKGLTKWFANSKPGVLADAYSKSMTTSCLCSLAGRRSGDSPLGSIRRRLPYCVYTVSKIMRKTVRMCESTYIVVRKD